MEERRKIFLSRMPLDEEIDELKEIVRSKKIKDHLKDSYIYIYFHEDDGVDVLAFKEKYINPMAADYNISPKQAVELLYNKIDIEQSVKELLYWCGIDSYRKFLPVIAEAKMKSGMEKVYADFAVYAKDDVDAAITLNEMQFDEYLYLEDVDE